MRRREWRRQRLRRRSLSREAADEPPLRGAPERTLFIKTTKPNEQKTPRVGRIFRRRPRFLAMLTEDVVGILFLLEGLAVSALAFAGFAAFVRPSIFFTQPTIFSETLACGSDRSEIRGGVSSFVNLVDDANDTKIFFFVADLLGGHIHPCARDADSCHDWAFAVQEHQGG